MRGLIDRKGELFAYLDGDVLLTLDGTPTGRRQGSYIVDLNGTRVWRVLGDAVYSLDGGETIGFLGAERGPDY